MFLFVNRYFSETVVDTRLLFDDLFLGHFGRLLQPTDCQYLMLPNSLLLDLVGHYFGRFLKYGRKHSILVRRLPCEFVLMVICVSG